MKLHNVIANITNGNWMRAMDMIEEGCKTKRYKYAKNVIDVIDELEHIGNWNAVTHLKTLINNRVDW